MISIEQYEYLLKLPKKVELKGNLEEEVSFNTEIPMKNSFKLISPEDSEFSFIYVINQSEKNHYKLSLFLMHDDEKIGLIRIDFNGQHLNPESITENLPDKFHRYAGKFFKYDEPHIHYHIDGYKNLAWAIPLENDPFKIKEINNQEDTVNAFCEFNSLINLQTKFLLGTKFLV
ncbi:MAG: hypothetical protein KBD37_01740 [Burkholderiales bacterium]|nr:hypothetical protein [Burkholderiales bacterium]